MNVSSSLVFVGLIFVITRLTGVSGRGSWSGRLPDLKSSVYGHTITRSSSRGSFSKGTAEVDSYGESDSQRRFSSFTTDSSTSSGQLVGFSRTYFFYSHNYGNRDHFGDDICVARINATWVIQLDSNLPVDETTTKSPNEGTIVYWDCDGGEFCDDEKLDCISSWFDWFAHHRQTVVHISLAVFGIFMLFLVLGSASIVVYKRRKMAAVPTEEPEP